MTNMNNQMSMAPQMNMMNTQMNMNPQMNMMNTMNMMNFNAMKTMGMNG